MTGAGIKDTKKIIRTRKAITCLFGDSLAGTQATGGCLKPSKRIKIAQMSQPAQKKIPMTISSATMI